MSATALSTIDLMLASSVVRSATATRPCSLGFALPSAFGEPDGLGDSLASGAADGHADADGAGDVLGFGLGEPLGLFWPSRPSVSAATSLSAFVRMSFS